MPPSTLPARPIFIVGFPRSGTTLLQAMLAAQPGIVSFRETHYFEIAARLGILDEDSPIESSVLVALLHRVKRTNEYSFTDDCVDVFRAKAAGGTLRSREVFEQLVTCYLAERDTESRRDVRWLEKTPGHIASMEAILAWYPDAQFLCVFRDPRAAIASAWTKLRRSDGSPPSWRRLVRRWRECAHQYEHFKRWRPDRVLKVTYETLVQDPASALEGVATFLDTPISLGAAMTFRHVAPTLVRAGEWWKLDVLSGPFANTNDRRQLPSRVAAFVQSALEPEMVRYGYDTPIALRRDDRDVPEPREAAAGGGLASRSPVPTHP